MPLSAELLLGFFAGALVSIAIYALRGRKRDSDTDEKGAHLFSGSGDLLLHWFMWILRPTVALSVRLGLGPDFYNYAGLLLGLASGIFFALGWLAAGGCALAACGVCDILDGRIARAMGVASSYGDFIDSTFDRFVESFVFLGFAMYLRETPYGSLLAGAALAASLVVSYARARGEVLGVLCTGGLMQRGERLVLITLVSLVDAPLAAYRGWDERTLVQGMLVFVAVTSAITAVHRTYWIAARLR